ncbi:inositol monophosphatase [Halobacteriales archaeon QS_8_69_26]|nr:MAG: inositol monophosphatase [Halobacteriales archaeon QS_8_69_26]
MTDLDAVEATAVEAVRAGGDYLREAFRGSDADAEYGPHDVESEADRESERRVLSVVREAFPDHRITAEESGEHAGDPNSPYRWVIDPLDGTNDFVAGLPTFGVCATVLEDEEPVVAAVEVPAVEDRYVARRGEGVRYNGDPVTAEGSGVATEAATVGWVIGHEVKREPQLMATAATLQDALSVTVKRVIESWSPTVHWGVFARGRIEGMVTYHADQEEQHAGELLAEEAGAHVHRFGPLYVATVDEGLHEELVDLTEPIG